MKRKSCILSGDLTGQKSNTSNSDATGRKLRTSYKASASATAVPTDYCGNMIYENGVLKQILVDGGYVTFSGTTPNYFYYLKDHLGNNRVVLTPSGTPIQVNHYYPFGGLFGESTGGSTQRFMYNGKELDRTHGLDWYDYGARHMTPDVGRFTTIDPMAEKYYSISPYAYCANNPIKYIDVKGEEPGDFFKTKDEAAIDFGNFYNGISIRHGKEYGSSIYEIKNHNGDIGYTYSVANIGNYDEVTVSYAPFGTKTVATIHTHGSYSNGRFFDNEFSGIRDDNNNIISNVDRKRLMERNDIGNSNRRQIDSYLVTPNGSLQKYDPKKNIISIISNDMPSDPNDPDSLNSNYVESDNFSINDFLNMLRIETYTKE